MVPGTLLGSYEIVSLLGAGGMGEVYRAHDRSLGRDVALKLLPPAVADDPERVARFQREAQLLASLNHANIGAIYGLEQQPAARFLVLELAEGGTLAARIASGRVPLGEASGIARQIALALQAAHDKGVVHRDLKPSNVAFTAAGDVKVLDFGLAKLGDRADIPVSTVSLSPTITSPALMTGIGTLLGTAAYMAPEQARGKPADKRSDVWAFGCVFYEMLTATRAFEGDDIADTLANVMKVEPDWSRLPSSLPPAITVLLRRCLAKDPRQRTGDIAAALILLEESAHLTQAVASSAPATPPTVVRRLVVPAVVTLVVAAAAAAATWLATRPEPPRVVRTSIVLGSEAGPVAPIAITPDGTHIVYVNNLTQLVVRALDELEPRTLVSGNNNIINPAVSPDGQFVVFAEGGLLKQVAIAGGPASTITRLDGPLRGAAWLPDSTIVYATANGSTGLQRVAASGGEPTVLTTLDPKNGEGDHYTPVALPGGRALLFTAIPTGGGTRQIEALNLETGTRTALVRGIQPRYVQSGHLLYAVDGVLQAVPFNPDTLAIRGTPVPVLQQIAVLGGTLTVMDVAANGTLVYARSTGAARRPVWVDRDGRETAITAPPAMYQTARLSPDGRRLAYFEISSGGEYDVWILNIERGTVDKLTTERGRDSEPIWSPDSTRIAYHSASQPGKPGIFIRRADGAGTPERLTTGTHLPMSWSADGSWIAYSDFGDRGISVSTTTGLMRVKVEGDHTPQLVIKDASGRISPTERWVATTSGTTGSDEIYVLPFPDTSRGRARISTDGGLNPAWAPDGKTLFYRRGQSMMAVAVDGDDPSTWPKPRVLFEGPYLFDVGPTHYDVARDGRLLMVKALDAFGEGAPRQLVVVQNWFEELRRLAPLK